MHPPSAGSGRAGGTAAPQRARFRHFVWLEAGSGKLALSRPARQRVTFSVKLLSSESKGRVNMAKSIWEIDLDGKKHKVELTHGNVTGKIEIYVDGNKIEIPKSELPKLLGSGSRHKFNISGYPCQIAIDLNGSRYVYQLFVDGQLIPKGADQNRREQAEFDELRSVVVAPLLFLLGIGAFWFNWSSAHNSGFVFRGIALISPLPIIFALYLLVFPGDMSKFSTNALIRVVIVLLLVITLGFVNLYALLNGIY